MTVPGRAELDGEAVQPSAELPPGPTITAELPRQRRLLHTPGAQGMSRGTVATAIGQPHDLVSVDSAMHAATTHVEHIVPVFVTVGHPVVAALVVSSVSGDERTVDVTPSGSPVVVVVADVRGKKKGVRRKRRRLRVG